MIENFYAVIMAGGGGTRLWPLSRKKTPKQMLRLTENRSLFQIAVDRLNGLFNPDRILVVTVEEQAEALKKLCPVIPERNYIIEPTPRGTASVVGLAAKVVQNRDPNAVMAVLTADHFIANEEYFRQLLIAAKEVAEQDYLVTIGIQPTFPATGYGYIHRGSYIGEFSNTGVYSVEQFKEKPAQELANTFFERKDHDWNSGMFIWRVERILMEIEQWMPHLYHTLHEIEKNWTENDDDRVAPLLWNSIKPQTIDYGIMEKANKVAVLPAKDLGWNDVGSWESLFDVILPDENGNILIDAYHIGLDTTSSLICSQDSKRLVVTIGLKNIIIVDTEDAILLCNRNDSQQVKKLVDLLKRNGKDQYL